MDKYSNAILIALAGAALGVALDVSTVAVGPIFDKLGVPTNVETKEELKHCIREKQDYTKLNNLLESRLDRAEKSRETAFAVCGNPEETNALKVQISNMQENQKAIQETRERHIEKLYLFAEEFLDQAQPILDEQISIIVGDKFFLTDGIEIANERMHSGRHTVSVNSEELNFSKNARAVFKDRQIFCIFTDKKWENDYDGHAEVDPVFSATNIEVTCWKSRHIN